MEASAPTEQFAPPIEPLPARSRGSHVHRTPITSAQAQCFSCGAALAPDQRYCVDCGQRRGPARLTLADATAKPALEAADPLPTPRRAGVNSTFVGVIGTLLLAMGVGVLIGRTGNGTSAKSPPAQVVTVAGAGAAAGSTAEAATPQGGAVGASKAVKAAAAGSATHATAVPPTAKGATPKVVNVGSPGKGAGYQHGHFTGNFFGPEAE